MPVVRVMLQAKVKIRMDMGDCDGLTPLRAACFYGPLAMVELLVQHGVDVKKESEQRQLYTNYEEIANYLKFKRANYFLSDFKPKNK